MDLSSLFSPQGYRFSQATPGGGLGALFSQLAQQAEWRRFQNAPNDVTKRLPTGFLDRPQTGAPGGGGANTPGFVVGRPGQGVTRQPAQGPGGANPPGFVVGRPGQPGQGGSNQVTTPGAVVGRPMGAPQQARSLAQMFAQPQQTGLMQALAGQGGADPRVQQFQARFGRPPRDQQELQAVMAR